MINSLEVLRSIEDLCQMREELRLKLDYIEFAEQKRTINSIISSIVSDVKTLHERGSMVDDELLLEDIITFNWSTYTPPVSTE